MSLDVKLTRNGGNTLGTVEEVQRAIASVIADVVFSPDPGGNEKVAEIESFGLELPPSLRDFFRAKPPTITGESKRRDYSLQFHLGDGRPLRYLHISVRGDNDAATSEMDRLAAAHGWVLSDYSPKDAIDQGGFS